MTTERLGRIAWLAGLALLIVAPFIGLYPIFMMKALCFAIFACAFNLLLGFTGLLSFGHAAYLGAAAYGTGWLIKSAGWSPELGVLAGTLFAAAIGLVVGLIAIRRQGIYFAMITLAMAQMVYFVWLQAPFTGGEDGLQGVPRGKLLGLVDLESDTALYFVVLAVFVAVFLFIVRVVHSPFGPLHVCVLRAEVKTIDASPCGIGVATGIDDLHRSFSTALVSLRLCAVPNVPVVVADDYGGLVDLLAQCSIDRPLLDAEELESVMQHPWAAQTLDALLRSASVRDASRIAGVHHSTMQARLETMRDLLSFDPMDGIGRTRVGLAFLAWRIRHSTALDLPPPGNR